jgi:hypothetical protein
MGQKDLKKLYWEREHETSVDKTYRRHITNKIGVIRHTGKQLVLGYFIGAISLCRLIVGY